MSGPNPEDMEGFAVCVDAAGEVRRLLRVKPGSPTIAIVGDVMYVRAHLIDSLHGEPVWLYRAESQTAGFTHDPTTLADCAARGADEDARGLPAVHPKRFDVNHRTSSPGGAFLSSWGMSDAMIRPQGLHVVPETDFSGTAPIIHGTREPIPPIVCDIFVECTFATPCCNQDVLLQQYTSDGVATWKGVRCPGCEKSYTVKLDQNGVAIPDCWPPAPET